MGAKKKFDIGEQYRKSNLALSAESRKHAIQTEKVSYLQRSQLHVSPVEKKYYPELRDLDALALDIMQRGIQTPLRVMVEYSTNCEDGDIDHTYEVTSGHRRMAAYDIAVEKYGYSGGKGLPCIIDPRPDEESLYEAEEALILNNLQRDKTDYEKMMEIVGFKKCTEQRKAAGENIPVIRDRVKERLGVTDSDITRFEKIYNSLLPDLMFEFKNSNIAATVAYEVAKQEQACQEYINEYWVKEGALQSSMVATLVQQFYSGQKENVSTPEKKPVDHHIPASIADGCEELNSMVTELSAILDAERMGGVSKKLDKQLRKKIGKQVEQMKKLQAEIIRLVSTTENASEGENSDDRER